MKFRLRKPSLKKTISARTTGNYKRRQKKAINPYYGKKGMGWINNPKKAMYNKVYNKISFGITDMNNSISKTHTSKQITTNTSTVTIIGIIVVIILLLVFWQYTLALLTVFGLLYFFIKLK